MHKIPFFILSVLSFINATAQCDVPINVSINPFSNGATIQCIPMSNLLEFGVLLMPIGAPAPASGQYPDQIFLSTSANIQGLQCNSGYAVYVTSMCVDGMSEWAGPFHFYTDGCFQLGFPNDLSSCPVDGESCFNLHDNDDLIMNGNAVQGWYDIQYFGNLEDLSNLTNEIDQACLSSGTQTIFGHVEEYYTNTTSTVAFNITAQENNCNGLTLLAFLDTNQNGVKEADERNFPLGQFSYQLQDADVHTVSTPDGYFKISDNDHTHSYDVGFAIHPQYVSHYSIAIPSYSNVHPAAVGFNEVFFPIVSTSVYHDATVSLTAIRPPVPGFDNHLIIKYTNTGNQTESGTVIFTQAPEETFLNATASQGGTVANTAAGFSYDFSNLAPFETAAILVRMQTPAIPEVSIGQQLQQSVSVNIVDSMSESIFANLTMNIVGAWDPNDKMEHRGPEIPVDSFTPDDYLNYTIRFENTGNYPALNVKITDVLDQNLDKATVQVVASSHDVVMDRVSQNLVFRFNNIQLPPTSQSDPMQGHGFVSFKVKPLAFASGDVIANTASIYFDFNPAVITNTFETRFVAPLGIEVFDTSSVFVSPNPANDVVHVKAKDAVSVALFSVLGHQLLSSAAKPTHMIDVSALAAGIYFLHVTIGLQTCVKQLLVR